MVIAYFMTGSWFETGLIEKNRHKSCNIRILKSVPPYVGRFILCHKVH